MSLFDSSMRQSMIKALGKNQQATIGALTIYCMFFNPGEIIDIGSQQIIATAPSIVVDRDDVFVAGSWLAKSGKPGTQITVDAVLYTVTDRLPDDAGFVAFELTEGI